MKSDDWCRSMGLYTLEQKIAYWREQVAKAREPKPYRAWMDAPKSELARQWAAELRSNIVERQPGCDDE